MKGSVLLDSACYFTGTEASCADVDWSDSSVIVDFNLFYIGFPSSVCASADLTTIDADSVSGTHTLFTNFTLCHLLHLLVAIAWHNKCILSEMERFCKKFWKFSAKNFCIAWKETKNPCRIHQFNDFFTIMAVWAKNVFIFTVRVV